MKKVKALKRKPTIPTRLETFVKETRAKLGITQMDLAEILNVTPQYICNIENYCTTFPMNHLRKIAKKLNVSLDVLTSLRKKDLCEGVDRYFSVKLK